MSINANISLSIVLKKLDDGFTNRRANKVLNIMVHPMDVDMAILKRLREDGLAQLYMSPTEPRVLDDDWIGPVSATKIAPYKFIGYADSYPPPGIVAGVAAAAPSVAAAAPPVASAGPPDASVANLITTLQQHYPNVPFDVLNALFSSSMPVASSAPLPTPPLPLAPTLPPAPPLPPAAGGLRQFAAARSTSLMGAFSHANPCAGINLGVDDDDDDVSLAQLRDQLFSRGGAASVAGANVTAPGVNATDPGVNATASAPGAITTVSSANVTASVFGGNVTASGANVTASVLGGNVTASAANLAASGNNNLAENNAALKRPVDSPADKDKGNGKAKGKSANRKPPKSKKSLDMQVHAHVHVLHMHVHESIISDTTRGT